MKFKDFRNLIFSPCYVELGDVRCFVETHQPTNFDSYEVVGVRASAFDTFDEVVVVSLAESLTDNSKVVDTMSQNSSVYHNSDIRADSCKR